MTGPAIGPRIDPTAGAMIFNQAKGSGATRLEKRARGGRCAIRLSPRGRVN